MAGHEVFAIYYTNGYFICLLFLIDSDCQYYFGIRLLQYIEFLEDSTNLSSLRCGSGTRFKKESQEVALMVKNQFIRLVVNTYKRVVPDWCFTKVGKLFLKFRSNHVSISS